MITILLRFTQYIPYFKIYSVYYNIHIYISSSVFYRNKITASSHPKAQVGEAFHPLPCCAEQKVRGKSEEVRGVVSAFSGIDIIFLEIKEMFTVGAATCRPKTSPHIVGEGFHPLPLPFL